MTEIDSDVYYCLKAINGNVLDCTAGGDFSLHPANWGDYQRWELRPADSGFYQFVHKATGRVLDCSDGKLCLHDNNGGQYQHWKIEAANDGKFRIQNRITDAMLDESDGKPYLNAPNDGPYQVWWVYPYPKQKLTQVGMPVLESFKDFTEPFIVTTWISGIADKLGNQVAAFSSDQLKAVLTGLGFTSFGGDSRPDALQIMLQSSFKDQGWLNTNVVPDDPVSEEGEVATLTVKP